ncbi:NUDIX domain-containing protein [Micromonospora radicis]|uniref:8-oxo-dGTP diphosphatase n=1 Tax=Micromonospora radicis TaxID=1894971 RepID=A0A418MMV9_9ACTN|nr:NUDIX domain-containing protein [Micromonospora radicis]RIV30256.1 NUDIX domain-containing protein [Micromonospora radicis]
MHVVVCGALVENGAVLLVHRSPTRRAYPDLWDLPGGHVDADESELQALAREMREELGVHIVAESASRLGDWHAGSGEDAVHVGVWQIRDWVGSPANRAPDEHDDIAWVGISELGGLPLVFGALPALLTSLPEPGRLPRRDARTEPSAVSRSGASGGLDRAVEVSVDRHGCPNGQPCRTLPEGITHDRRNARPPHD